MHFRWKGKGYKQVQEELFTRFLRCPNCHSSFTLQENSLMCGQGHCFDLAKEGYVNLSLQQRPGDAREMLLARRLIFSRGFFEPVSLTLNAQVHAHLLNNYATSKCIVDAGCGEGYYLNRLQEQLNTQFKFEPVARNFLGLDISKAAIKLAAVRYPRLGFVVADINRPLVLADASVQVLFNIFAPRNLAEFKRVVASGGLLLTVIPTDRHLIELRDILPLMKIEKDKRESLLEKVSSAYTLLNSIELEYPAELNQEELTNLIRMTPNYWHIGRQAWPSIQSLTSLQTHFGFNILVFQRK